MLKGATWNKTAVAATSLDVPVPSNAVGDLMVIAWARFTNSLAYPTNADLTNGVGAINNWSTAGISYKEITGSPVSSPYTITFASPTTFSATIYIISGAAASPIGASATNNNSGSSTSRLSAASLTTTAANSMIIRSTANRAASAPRILDGSVFNTINAMSVSNDLSSVSGIDFVASSGGTTSAFHYERGSSVNFVDVALEIKTDGTTLPIRLDDNRTILLGNTGYGTPPTWVAPNSVGITTVNGKSMGSSAPTVTYGVPTSGSTEFPQQNAAISYTTYVANTFLGGFVPITGSIDGKVVCIPWGRDRNGQDRIGADGIVAAFVDTSGNWVAYTLRNYQVSFSSATRYDSFIKYGSTAELDSSLAQGGTEFDPSALAYFGLLPEGTTAASSVTSVLYFPLLWCEGSPSTMLGGGPDAPVNVSVAALLLAGGKGWMTSPGLQGTKQFQPQISFAVGDGTNATYLKTTGQSISFPTLGTDWKLADGDLSLTLAGSSDCTLDMSSSIVVGESRQAFSIESATSINLIGTSFIGLDWSNNADVDSSGASFADCNIVELGGGTTTNATISTPSGSTSATVSVSGAVLDGVSLSATKADGTATDYQLTLGSAVNVATLTDAAFSGAPAISKIYTEKAAGTVSAGAFVTGESYEIKTVGTTDFTAIGASANTIGVQFTATWAGSGTGDAYKALKIVKNGTTSLTAGDVSTVDGVKVWIAGAVVNQSVTVTGAIANSEIQVADVDYTFTVSGVTTAPVAGDTYTNNDITWTVTATDITAGAGTISAYGLGTPETAGDLTRATGSGDSTIAFSAWTRNVTTLYKGAPTFPYTWTDSAPAAAARAIRLRVAYCQGTVAKQMIESYIGVCGVSSGDAAIAYNAAQVGDATYNTWALDGPTILAGGNYTFTDASPDLITINAASVGATLGWPTLYAVTVAWLSSDDGIDDEIAYCVSPDPVNFIWENVRIKIPVGEAMAMTSGWGRDSVTGLGITLWDSTGGAISFDGPHTTGYPSGSGLDGGQSAELTSAAANAAAIKVAVDAYLDATISSRARPADVPSANDVAQEVVAGITF